MTKPPLAMVKVLFLPPKPTSNEPLADSLYTEPEPLTNTVLLSLAPMKAWRELTCPPLVMVSWLLPPPEPRVKAPLLLQIELRSDTTTKLLLAPAPLPTVAVGFVTAPAL